MQTLSYLVLIVTAVWLICVSVFMFARPESALVYLGKFASTNLINFTELGLRMIAGFAFVFYSEHSSYPQSFTIFGWMLVVTAGILMFAPRRWHSEYAIFWSKKLPTFIVRLMSALSLIAGLFLIYAI